MGMQVCRTCRDEPVDTRRFAAELQSRLAKDGKVPCRGAASESDEAFWGKVASTLESRDDVMGRLSSTGRAARSGSLAFGRAA